MKSMAYTKNPYLPQVRRDAADLVRRGWGVRKVARYIGVRPGTITKWVERARKIGYYPIPTLSSRPKHHPHQLSEEMIWKIYHKRLLIKRSAEVIHRELINEGVAISIGYVPVSERPADRDSLIISRITPCAAYSAKNDSSRSLLVIKKSRIHILIETPTSANIANTMRNSSNVNPEFFF